MDLAPKSTRGDPSLIPGPPLEQHYQSNRTLEGSIEKMKARRKAAFEYSISSTSAGGVSVLDMAFDRSDETAIFFPKRRLVRGQSAVTVVRNIGSCLPRPQPGIGDPRERKRQIWSTHSVGGAVRVARGTDGARLGETDANERKAMLGGRTLPALRVLMEPKQPQNIRNKAAASLGYMAIERGNQPQIGSTGGLLENFLTILAELASKQSSYYISFPDFSENEVIVAIDESGRNNLLVVATRGPNSLVKDLKISDVHQFYRDGERLPGNFTHLLCPRCGLGVPRKHYFVRDHLHHNFDDHIRGGDPDAFNYADQLDLFSGDYGSNAGSTTSRSRKRKLSKGAGACKAQFLDGQESEHETKLSLLFLKRLGELPFDPETQHWAHATCSGLRNLAIEPDNARRLAAADAMAPLCGILHRGSDSLRIASISCITAIALIDEEAAIRAVQYGVLPVAFEMLNDDINDMVRFTAVKLVNELSRRPANRTPLLKFKREPGELSSRMKSLEDHEPSLILRLLALAREEFESPLCQLIRENSMVSIQQLCKNHETAEVAEDEGLRNGIIAVLMEQMDVGTELGKISACELLIQMWPKYESTLIMDLEVKALTEEKCEEEAEKNTKKKGRAARAASEAASEARREQRQKQARMTVKMELEAIFPLAATFINMYTRERPPIRLQVKGCEFIMALLLTEELKTDFVLSNGDTVASIVNMVTRKYVGVAWHRRQKKWEATFKRRKIRGLSDREQEQMKDTDFLGQSNLTSDDFYYERLGFFNVAEEAARRYDEEAEKYGLPVNFPVGKDGAIALKAQLEGTELRKLGIKTLLHLCDGETPRVDQLVRKSDPNLNDTLKGLLFSYHRQRNIQMRDTVVTLLRELDQNYIIEEFCLGVTDEEATEEMKSIKDEQRDRARRKNYKMLSGVRKHFTATELRDHQAAFKKVDADGSGSIDNMELDAMFNSYGIHLNSAQLDLLVKESDIDGNGTIDFQEFLLIMLKIKRGQLGGPAADFAKATRSGNVGAAASAIKESLFGMSKKKREAIEKADAERERKRQEDEFNKREIEWRERHKTLLSYSSAEVITNKRERYFLSHHWFDLAEEFFTVLDGDQDGLVNWHETIKALNDDEYEDYSLRLGVNMVIPQNWNMRMEPIVNPLFPLNISIFKRYLKQIANICRALSNEVEESISEQVLIGLRETYGESQIDYKIATAERRNRAFIIKREVTRKQHERELELARLEGEAVERRAKLLAAEQDRLAAKQAADEAAGIENLFDASQLDDEPLDDLMRAILDDDGEPLILKFLTAHEQSELHFINKDFNKLMMGKDNFKYEDLLTPLIANLSVPGDTREDKDCRFEMLEAHGLTGFEIFANIIEFLPDRYLRESIALTHPGVTTSMSNLHKVVPEDDEAAAARILEGSDEENLAINESPKIIDQVALLSQVSMKFRRVLATSGQNFLSYREAVKEAAVAAEVEAEKYRWKPQRYYSLHFEIISARDLIAADRGGTSDPFLTVDLVSFDTGEPIKIGIFKPDSTGLMVSKGAKRLTEKTRTVKKTLHPVWHERFEWPGLVEDPSNLAFNLKVFDADMVTSEPLGQVTADQILVGEFPTGYVPEVKWYQLQCIGKMSIVSGSVQISTRLEFDDHKEVNKLAREADEAEAARVAACTVEELQAEARQRHEMAVRDPLRQTWRRHVRMRRPQDSDSMEEIVQNVEDFDEGRNSEDFDKLEEIMDIEGANGLDSDNNDNARDTHDEEENSEENDSLPGENVEWEEDFLAPSIFPLEWSTRLSRDLSRAQFLHEQGLADRDAYDVDSLAERMAALKVDILPSTPRSVIHLDDLFCAPKPFYGSSPKSPRFGETEYDEIGKPVHRILDLTWSFLDHEEEDELHLVSMTFHKIINADHPMHQPKEYFSQFLFDNELQFSINSRDGSPTNLTFKELLLLFLEPVKPESPRHKADRLAKERRTAAKKRQRIEENLNAFLGFQSGSGSREIDAPKTKKFSFFMSKLEREKERAMKLEREKLEFQQKHGTFEMWIAASYPALAANAEKNQAARSEDNSEMIGVFVPSKVADYFYLQDNDHLFVWNRHPWTTNRRIQPVSLVSHLEEEDERNQKQIKTDDRDLLPVLSRSIHRCIVGSDHWIECYREIGERFIKGDWHFNFLEEKNEEDGHKDGLERPLKEIKCMPFQQQKYRYDTLHGGVFAQAVRNIISNGFVDSILCNAIDMVMGRDPAEDLTPEQRESFSKAFLLFDIDGGGHIDSEELQAVVHALNLNPTRAEFEQMMQEADSDGTGTIDLGEFLTMMALHMANHSNESGDKESAEQLAGNLQDAAASMQEARAFRWLKDRGFDAEENPHCLAKLVMSSWDEWLQVTSIMEAIHANDLTMVRFISTRYVEGVLVDDKIRLSSSPRNEGDAANRSIISTVSPTDDDRNVSKNGMWADNPSSPTKERSRQILLKLLRTRSSEGETALHYACRYGSLPAVQWLVENGMGPEDMDVLDDFGHTPIYHADLKKHQIVVEWIEEFKMRVYQSSNEAYGREGSSHPSLGSSRDELIQPSARKLGLDLDLDLPPRVMVSGGLHESAMGEYVLFSEEGWYKQSGSHRRRNFLWRSPDSGLWIFTKEQKWLAEDKGITVSYCSAHLPTRAGMRWFSLKSGQWKEDKQLHVTAIDEIN